MPIKITFLMGYRGSLLMKGFKETKWILEKAKTEVAAASQGLCY